MKHFMTEPLRMLTKHLSLWHQVMRDRNVLEMAKNRTLVAGAAFSISFILIFIRLADIMAVRPLGELWSGNAPQVRASAGILTTARADIIDRNGEILATHLITGSVYANPKVIINAEEAAAKLSGLIPELDYKTVLRKLTSEKGFVWIVRHISPKLQQAVNHLGIPGIYLHRDERRVYPYGSLVSHVLGYCGIDNDGLAGVEKSFDSQLRGGSLKFLQLSLDVRVQHIVHDELAKAIIEFGAEGGNAMVMKVNTGELLAMVSLPDYDPNLPNQNYGNAAFNRNTLGTYEPGSTFKIFNTVIALETGTATLNSQYDNSVPLRIGRFRPDDWRVKIRGLISVKEIFMHSSNIGSAKMALQFGGGAQKTYLGKFGFLKAPTLELPEIGTPLVPSTWRDVTTMTISYGYGIAVTPLQLLVAVAGIVNEGNMRPATLIRRTPETVSGTIRVVSAKTSSQIRDLMRMVVTDGTAKVVNIPGYDVIAKTGSAHKKSSHGRCYDGKAKITSCIVAFPKDHPQYMVVVFLDNPKPTKNTYGFTTGGWNAAPTVGHITARIAPLLGLAPALDEEEAGKRLMQDNLIPVNYQQGEG